MTLTAATTRNDYTATSGQTVFPYTFTALSDTDIKVVKNGSTLTLGAGNDYTVSGIGSYGGNVTLNVGATTGDTLSVYLDMPIDRTTNYQNSGDFLAADVNGDVNKSYIAMQQLSTALAQGVRKPLSDAGSINMELPIAANRANRILGFDATGAPAMQDSTGVNSNLPTPLDFGATGNGVADDTAAIQSWLNAGGGYWPSGTYLISSTLVIPQRAIALGHNDGWSPDAAKNTIVKWAGAANGVMVQAATQPFGTPSTASLTGIRIEYLTLDGNDVAGIGLYGNYVTNDSTVAHIATIQCNLFGILASKLWYSDWHDLVARNCNGVGVAFGWNYLNTFDDNSVNGVYIYNVRGHTCGQRYNASTAPTGFSLASAPLGGCGIYLKLKTSSRAVNLLGEKCYGAGLVVDPNIRARVDIDSFYVESNMNGALTDGETDLKYGLILANTASEYGLVNLNGGYFHIENNSNVYYYQTNTGANFDFDVLRGPLEFRTNLSAGAEVPISARTATGTISWTDMCPAGLREAQSTKVLAAGAGTNTTKGGIVHNAVTFQKTDWATGTPLTVAEVTMSLKGQGKSSSASLILHIGIQGFDTSTANQSIYGGTFLINMVAGIPSSTESTTQQSSTVTSLGTTQLDTGTPRITVTTPTVTFVAAGDPAVVTATIEITPTATGTESYNSIVAASTLLGGGLNAGSNPLLTTCLTPN